MSILTIILLLPLIGAIVSLAIPRTEVKLLRQVALLSSALTLVFACFAFASFKSGGAGLQFEQKFTWVSGLGISYHVGADGLNIAMILLAAIVAFAASAVSWDIDRRQKEFYILLQLMICGILGAFASLDLFFFYFFHELALVPTFIMIGVWGRGAEKNYAAFKITMYLSLGALLALVGLAGLYVAAGINSFNIIELTAHFRNNPIGSDSQAILFAFLLFGFGILVSLWPFHTWAPMGYEAAPTATAMLHAGVLKKFGLYGLIRIAMPMLPEGARQWLYILAFLCLGNILYCGFVAMQQKKLSLLIGNSSVAHMGFIFLGIASLTLIGLTGALVVMFAHGLLAALSFALNGYLYHQRKDLDMASMGGLLKKMPFVGTSLIIAMMAGCGLPGFANFAGEILVFFGAWTPFKLVTALACWGALVIGGVYMLRAIRSMLHGPSNEATRTYQDVITPWRRLPYALLIVSLLGFGIFPGSLTRKMEPAAAEVLSAFESDSTIENQMVGRTFKQESIAGSFDNTTFLR